MINKYDLTTLFFPSVYFFKITNKRTRIFGTHPNDDMPTDAKMEFQNINIKIYSIKYTKVIWVVQMKNF